MEEQRDDQNQGEVNDDKPMSINEQIDATGYGNPVEIEATKRRYEKEPEPEPEPEPEVTETVIETETVEITKTVETETVTTVEPETTAVPEVDLGKTNQSFPPAEEKVDLLAEAAAALPSGFIDVERLRLTDADMAAHYDATRAKRAERRMAAVEGKLSTLSPEDRQLISLILGRIDDAGFVTVLMSIATGAELEQEALEEQRLEELHEVEQEIFNEEEGPTKAELTEASGD